MATSSPDVQWRFNEMQDTMVNQALSGIDLTGTAFDNLLVQMKTYLDANFAQFKDSNGLYTVPHIKHAVLAILSRGK